MPKRFRSLIVCALTFAAAGLARAGLDEADLRRRLSSEDPAVRESADSELIDNWDLWKPDDLVVLDRLSVDTDPEVAAHANSARERIGLLRRVGPWLYDELNVRREARPDGKPDPARLETVAQMWAAGEASDAEVEAWLKIVGKDSFPQETWRGDTCFIGRMRVRPLAFRVVQGLKENTSSLAVSEAMDSLGACGNVSAIPEVAKFYTSTENGIRAAAFRAAASLGDHSAGVLARAALEDDDEQVRAAATQVLGILDDAKDEVLLATQLGDVAGSVRAAAADSAARRGFRGLAAEIAGLLHDPDGKVVEASANALLGLRAREELPKLIAALGQEYRNPNAAVEKAISSLQTEECLPALIALLASSNESERVGAMNAIRTLTNPADVGLVRTLLDAPHATSRRCAIQVLSECNVPGWERLAIDLLGDDSTWVRQSACDCLSFARSREAVPRYLSLLNSYDTELRRTAGFGLSWAANPEFTVRCRKTLGSPDREGRSDAIYWLSVVADVESAGRIAALLDSKEPFEADNAARALGKFGIAACADRLAAMLNSSYASSRFGPAESLLQLGRPDLVGTFLESNPDPSSFGPLQSPPELLLYGDQPWTIAAYWRSLRPQGTSELYWREPGRAEVSRTTAWPALAVRDLVRRLRNLERLPDEKLSISAALALVEHGLKSPVEERELLERACKDVLPIHYQVRDALRALSASHACEADLLLRRRVTIPEMIADEAGLGRFLGTLGLKFEPGPFRLRGRIAKDFTTSGLALLWDQTTLSDWSWVVEDRTIRVMLTRDALEYWRAKLPR